MLFTAPLALRLESSGNFEDVRLGGSVGAPACPLEHNDVDLGWSGHPLSAPAPPAGSPAPVPLALLPDAGRTWPWAEGPGGLVWQRSGCATAFPDQRRQVWDEAVQVTPAVSDLMASEGTA